MDEKDEEDNNSNQKERHNKNTRESYHRRQAITNPGVKKHVIESRFPRQKKVDNTGWTPEQKRAHNNEANRRSRQKQKTILSDCAKMSDQYSNNNNNNNNSPQVQSTPQRTPQDIQAAVRLASTPAPMPLHEQFASFSRSAGRPPTPMEAQLMFQAHRESSNRALLSETANNAMQSNNHAVALVAAALGAMTSPAPPRMAATRNLASELQSVDEESKSGQEPPMVESNVDTPLREFALIFFLNVFLLYLQTTVLQSQQQPQAQDSPQQQQPSQQPAAQQLTAQQVLQAMVQQQEQTVQEAFRAMAVQNQQTVQEAFRAMAVQNQQSLQALRNQQQESLRQMDSTNRRLSAALFENQNQTRQLSPEEIEAQADELLRQHGIERTNSSLRALPPPPPLDPSMAADTQNFRDEWEQLGSTPSFAERLFSSFRSNNESE